MAAEAVGQFMWTFPLAAILMAFAFETCPDSEIVAARNLNGSFLRTLYWVGLPTAQGALLAAFCIAFAFSLSDGLSNAYLNGHGRLTIVDLIESFSKDNNHKAAAATCFLVIIQLPTVYILRKLVTRVSPASPTKAAL